MKKPRIFAAIAAAAIALVVPVATASAATTVQKDSCTSAGVNWKTSATWRDPFVNWDNKTKRNLTVGWTTTSTVAETMWTVVAKNSDGTVAQKYYAHGPFNYQNGEKEQTFTVDRQPVGNTPSVTIELGTFNNKIAPCTTTFALSGGSTPSPTPTPSATPSETPTVTPSPTPSETPTVTPSPTPTVTPTPTPSPSATPTVPSGTVLFEENFDGPAGTLPDPTKWRDYGPCMNAKQGFGQIKCGAKETMNGNGQLVIPALPAIPATSSTPAQAAEGQGLTTSGKFTFTYGTYSARVKVPTQSGYWPAVWTENRPADYHKVELYGETDALEHYGFQPQYAHTGGTIAWSDYTNYIWSGTDNFCTKPGVTNFGDEYHTFSVKVEPTRVTGYIDGTQCNTTVKPTDPKKPWPFGPGFENYLILNLAVGGAGGQQDGQAKTPAEFLVDSVTVTSL